jgi:hypothetical protein
VKTAANGTADDQEVAVTMSMVTKKHLPRRTFLRGLE